MTLVYIGLPIELKCCYDPRRHFVFIPALEAPAAQVMAKHMDR